MRFLMLVAALVVAPALVAGQTRPPDWNLQVGLFGYRPDGTVSATAFESQFPRSSFVFVSETGCGVGAGLNPLGQTPFHAWSFTGDVIAMTPEVAVIQLDWQRVIDSGKPATVPGGSVQLTLQAGDRVLLDAVVPHTTAAPCWSSVAFEARYRANPIGADSGLPWRLRRIQRTEVDDATGSGGIVTPDGSASSRGTGNSGSARSAGAAPNTAVTASSYDVHLWLVRSAPGKPEESQYRQVSVAGIHTPFSFAPLSIGTRHGEAGVTVSGSLGVKDSPDGEHLLLLMHRQVIPQAGSPASPRYSQSHIKVLPTPDKVLSFEMPPVSVGDQQLPDRLSVRLRVEPR